MTEPPRANSKIEPSMYLDSMLAENIRLWILMSHQLRQPAPMQGRWARHFFLAARCCMQHLKKLNIDGPRHTTWKQPTRGDLANSLNHQKETSQLPSTDDDNNEARRTAQWFARLVFQVESLTSTNAQLARRRQGEQINWIKHESPLSEIPTRAVYRGGLELSSAAPRASVLPTSMKTLTHKVCLHFHPPDASWPCCT